MRIPPIALMPHVVPVGPTVPRLDSVCKIEQSPVRANPYAHIRTLQFWFKLWRRTPRVNEEGEKTCFQLPITPMSPDALREERWF
jgi:hypothetical protein